MRDERVEDVAILEKNSLIIPVECLRLKLKAHQRVCDREFTYFHNALQSWQSQPNADHEESMKALSYRISSLLNSILILEAEESDLVTRIEDRVAHIHSRASVHDKPSLSSWHDIRLKRFLVDYMLHRGLTDVASDITSQHHLDVRRTYLTQTLVDLDIFQRMRRIEESLSFCEGKYQSPSCDLALEWCHENKAVLRKIDSTLELELRLQEYIELVRPGTMEGRRKAVQYARKHFLSIAKSLNTSHECHSRIQRAMGILAFQKSSGLYADLYDKNRWNLLKNEFRNTTFKVYHVLQTPLIHIALSAGLSSLKALPCTPNTAAGHEKDTPYPEAFILGMHRTCPTCQSNRLGSLAAKVPRNHHNNSTLICRITGKVMDDRNPPMCLPNGIVYSEEVCDISLL